MSKDKVKKKSARRINDYRTSRFFARMLSVFGWAFLLVWLVVGLRYGVTLGQEVHTLMVKFVWDGTPLLLVNLFLVMWLLALVMFGFMFVVAGQGMRAVFEMANSSKQLVRLTQEDMAARRGADIPEMAKAPKGASDEIKAQAASAPLQIDEKT